MSKKYQCNACGYVTENRDDPCSCGGKAFTVLVEGDIKDPPPGYVKCRASYEEEILDLRRVLARAIQDYDRGKLIGSNTFGKASVQLLFDLSDGSSMHITNAHWLTPSRHEIHGIGLTPDIEVELSEQDHESERDPQREQAVAYLREQGGQPTSASREGTNP